MAAALLSAQLCYEHGTRNNLRETSNPFFCTSVLRQQQLSAEKQKLTQSQLQKLYQTFYTPTTKQTNKRTMRIFILVTLCFATIANGLNLRKTHGKSFTKKRGDDFLWEVVDAWFCKQRVKFSKKNEKIGGFKVGYSTNLECSDQFPTRGSTHTWGGDTPCTYIAELARDDSDKPTKTKYHKGIKRPLKYWRSSGEYIWGSLVYTWYRKQKVVWRCERECCGPNCPHKYTGWAWVKQFGPEELDKKEFWVPAANARTDTITARATVLAKKDEVVSSSKIDEVGICKEKKVEDKATYNQMVVNSNP
jgi:hypothetical protein